MNVEMKCYIIPLPPDGALEVQQRRAPAKGSHSLQVAFQLLVNGYISSLFNSDHCHNSQAHVCHSNPPWTSRDEPATASIVPLRPTTPVLSPLILFFIKVFGNEEVLEVIFPCLARNALYWSRSTDLQCLSCIYVSINTNNIEHWTITITKIKTVYYWS